MPEVAPPQRSHCHNGSQWPLQTPPVCPKPVPLPPTAIGSWNESMAAAESARAPDRWCNGFTV